MTFLFNVFHGLTHNEQNKLQNAASAKRMRKISANKQDCLLSKCDSQPLNVNGGLRFFTVSKEAVVLRWQQSKT